MELMALQDVAEFKAVCLGHGSKFVYVPFYYTDSSSMSSPIELILPGVRSSLPDVVGMIDQWYTHKAR
jgi:hypothetical protein